MKVLVNGCSHLAGNELHDDLEIAGKLTWPNFIPEWTVKNIAQGASSNDSIVRRTVDELETQDYDFVYVQWTSFNRIELQIPFYKEHGLEFEWFCINSRNAESKFSLNNNGEFIHKVARSIFLKQFNTQWFDNYNLSSMITLQSYLQQKNIPYKFGLVNRDFFNTNSPRVKLIDTCKIVSEPWQVFCNQKPFKKLSAFHYEHQAHHAYAEYIKTLNITKEIT